MACEPVSSARRSADHDRVQQVLLNRESHIRLPAAFEAGDRLIAAPPDQEVRRQALLQRLGIEVQPLHAVVHFQQLLGLRRSGHVAQLDAVRDARRNLGAGKKDGRQLAPSAGAPPGS